MKSTAKAFITLAALVLGLGASLARAEAAFSARELAEGVLLVQGPAGNTLVAHDSDGLILVDGVPEAAGADYLNFVRERTGEDRIKALLLTHWHPEVAGLNEVLGGRGVPIIAHAYTRQWLGATIRRRGAEVIHEPVPDHALPSETFHQDYRLPFRGGEIVLGHMLQAHTDGDFYVHFPQQDILYTGDVLRSGAWAPVHEASNGYLGRQIDALDQLAALIGPRTLVVPGSGEPMGQAGFEEQHALYDKLMEEMVALLRQAKSAEEVVAMDPAARLKPEWRNSAEFLDQGFRSFYVHLRDSRHLGSMP